MKDISLVNSLFHTSLRLKILLEPFNSSTLREISQNGIMIEVIGVSLFEKQ